MPLDFNSLAPLFLTENPPDAPAAVTLEPPTPAPMTAGSQMQMEMPEAKAPAAVSPEEFEAGEELPFVMGEEKSGAMELPGVPKELADLMRADHVTAEQLQAAVAKKGYYPAGTPIANYDPGFISGCLVACWDSVKKIID